MKKSGEIELEIRIRCKEIAATAARLATAVGDHDIPKSLGNNLLLSRQAGELQSMLLVLGMAALGGERISEIVHAHLKPTNGDAALHPSPGKS